MKLITRSEAISQGLSRYLAKPCPQGHTTGRSVKSMACLGCIRDWNIRNKEQNNARQRETRLRRKQELFDLLGGKCSCCGEANLVFLSVDHKNGGGTKHRKTVLKWPARFYNWLYQQIKERGIRVVRKEFRVLCHNCNMAYAILGFCPHTVKLQQEKKL